MEGEMIRRISINGINGVISLWKVREHCRPVKSEKFSTGWLSAKASETKPNLCIGASEEYPLGQKYSPSHEITEVSSRTGFRKENDTHRVKGVNTIAWKSWNWQGSQWISHIGDSVGFFRWKWRKMKFKSFNISSPRYRIEDLTWILF